MLTETTHRVSHFVYGVPGDRETLVRREATMRGAWACEAKCSCGWETRTGGGTRRYVAELVSKHKWEVAHGFWQPA